jgi:hypothetical protein
MFIDAMQAFGEGADVAAIQFGECSHRYIHPWSFDDITAPLSAIYGLSYELYT